MSNLCDIKVPSPYILILYDSQTGSTENMANLIRRGVDSHEHITSKLFKVLPVNDPDAQKDPVAIELLAGCAGLIVGSPCRFGNVSASMKLLIDQTTPLWLAKTLVNKPFAVFTSSGSYHAGQESTLLTMLLPWIHHGMIHVGLPYTVPALGHTKTGGGPYGASHIAGKKNDRAIDSDEHALCVALGQRVADIAHHVMPLSNNQN